MLKDLKEIAPYFIGFFILFLLIGFFYGLDNRRNTVLDNIYSGLMADTGEHGFFLTHECNNKWTHRFYVDNNKLLKSADTQSKYLSKRAYGPPSQHNIKHRNIIISLLGGASGGFSYKDFYNASKKKVSRIAALKKSIFGFIGAVSGYAVGFWLGSEYDTQCDAAFSLDVLSKTTFWTELEQQWIYFSITETEYGEEPLLWRTSGQNINPTEDDPIVLCKTSLHKALTCLKNEVENEATLDFNNHHFKVLHSLTDRYNDIQKLPEYEQIKRMNLGRLSKGHAVLAKHYGYSLENWNNTCQLIEQSIQNEQFLTVLSEACP